MSVIGTRPQLVLHPASLRDGIEIWSMIQEIGPGENGFHNEGYEIPYSRFTDFLRRVTDARLGRGLPRGYVPQTTYWAYVGTRPVGVAKLRHRLTDALRVTGGHIGYAIRPSERGKGYGTKLLRQTLTRAAEMGITEVLITVNENNVPSWKLVERNYGRLVRRADGKRYYEVATCAE
jgi:predicted acetyltransferase